jgi:hypothetical protein
MEVGLPGHRHKGGKISGLAAVIQTEIEWSTVEADPLQ